MFVFSTSFAGLVGSFHLFTSSLTRHNILLCLFTYPFVQLSTGSTENFEELLDTWGRNKPHRGMRVNC